VTLQHDANNPNEAASGPSDFAPSDYTDGRKTLDWETRYPNEARKKIRTEAIYLSIILVACLAVMFYAIYQFPASNAANQSDQSSVVSGNTVVSSWQFGLFCAWLSGTVGGTLFSIKWLYHSVAKHLWNEDRRLWRLFTPHISGAVSLFTVLLIASGVLQIFDENSINRPLMILGVGFLVGYFSDKALAKLAETADTLFGATKP